MNCKHCGKPMVISRRVEDIIVWQCKDESCDGFWDKQYEETGERPPFYNNHKMYKEKE